LLPTHIREHIRLSLQQGESHFREFKSAFDGPPEAKLPRGIKDIRRDIAEAVVAFANADGGELFIGVEDDGHVTGLPQSTAYADKILIDLPSLFHPDGAMPGYAPIRVDIGGTEIVGILVDKCPSGACQTSDGKCVQRRDRHTVPVAFKVLALSEREAKSRQYDREFSTAAVADLDQGLLHVVGERLGLTSLSDEMLLNWLGLAEWVGRRLRLRRAATLLFAKDVSHWHPRCAVRIVKVAGDALGEGESYLVEKDLMISKPVLTLIDEAWGALQPMLSRESFAHAQFISRSIFPEAACVEAITNAVTHRDYSIEGRPIEILVYPTRVEFRNPGALLSTVSLDSLLRLEGAHESRNVAMSRVLREVGRVREMGEGLRRIFQSVRQDELADPELVSSEDSFSVSLSTQIRYSPEAARWLNLYANFNLARDERQVLLRGMGGQPLSTNDILEATSMTSYGEPYNDLMDRLHYKGLIDNLLPQGVASQAAKKRRIARKDLKKYVIVDPEEANDALDELFAVCARVGTQPAQVLPRLNPRSRYRSRQFARVLDALDMAARLRAQAE
jgi:ATP-dependent DNA helicase RecG